MTGRISRTAARDIAGFRMRFGVPLIAPPRTWWRAWAPRFMQLLPDDKGEDEIWVFNFFAASISSSQPYSVEGRQMAGGFFPRSQYD
jgi:hypothetical protein